ncbi:hypothetical protein [Microterricola pindariensis]|uniref:Fe-S oxidoreductase n=1 Tax=Microterricola pindariensis TaxID=478010 RepID=A0ABX5B018_9MICO|nr:hypothetical protein [Microterricola pindariensis]PPL20517.1 hypothetical protein GY24_00325 [Microterricola pindariensis]
MQLGKRWAFGASAPDTLPEVVLVAVEAVESDEAPAGVDRATWRWTLTWLENKPVLELDDGTVIRYDAEADSATITQRVPASTSEFAESDDEDW